MRGQHDYFPDSDRDTLRRRRAGAASSFLTFLMVAGVIGSLAAASLGLTGVGGWLLDSPATGSAAPEYTHTFSMCSGPRRVNCVVDGDTFWLEGVKIRIADINTPEISSPQCAHEAELGRKAADRLMALLNQGAFILAPADRDEDQYGRKLRIVERDGQSVGAQMVAEGLAHEWLGRRESWC